MLFIHPMWLDEVERIGMEKCTPTGYAIRDAADGLGAMGCLMLFVVIALVAFGYLDLWFLALPFGVGIISEVLYHTSEYLAYRKSFHYDYAKRESTWLDAGERRSYTYEMWQKGDR